MHYPKNMDFDRLMRAMDTMISQAPGKALEEQKNASAKDQNNQDMKKKPWWRF